MESGRPSWSFSPEFAPSFSPIFYQNSSHPTTLCQSQPNLLQPTQVTEAVRPRYTYNVRIINPKKKSDFVVRMWHNVSDVFQSPSTLKARLQESFPNDVPKELDFRCGYFHGNSKQWIFEENDLKTMYKLFPSGSNITIWCDALVVDVAQQSSKKRKCEGDSLNDEIFKNLKDKNPEMTSPKLRLWAKLIECGHYDSYDQPPDIPLIAGGHSDKKTVHQSLSPMKSAQLRRAYLEDLKSLKSLKDDGVLSDEEFVAEKKKVLSSLQSLT